MMGSHQSYMTDEAAAKRYYAKRLDREEYARRLIEQMEDDGVKLQSEAAQAELYERLERRREW